MDVSRINRLFESHLVVINMGVDSFGANLKAQGVRVLQMSWRPPAGGNRELLALLEKLGR
jgi:hypothetical protein